MATQTIKRQPTSRLIRVESPDDGQSVCDVAGGEFITKMKRYL